VACWRFDRPRRGRAKTLLLAELYKAIGKRGVDIVSGDYETQKKDKAHAAISRPTNKAGIVLRLARCGPATHDPPYPLTPVYDPEI